MAARPKRNVTHMFPSYIRNTGWCPKAQSKALTVGLLALSLVSLVSASPLSAQESSGTLTVRVHDGRGENPLERVRVELLRFPDTLIMDRYTDGSGAVVFSGFPPGSYIVRAAQSDYLSAEIRVDFRRGDNAPQTVELGLMPLEKAYPHGPGGIVAARKLRVPDAARKEFERGTKLLNQKKQPRAAVRAFQNAVALFPDYPEAFSLMGTAYFQLGEIELAEQSLRKALSLDSETTHTYYPLAMLLFGQKKYDEEREILLQALNLDPTDWRWTFELARAEAQQGNWEPALQHALEASKLPNVGTKVHLLLGDIYSNMGRLKEAIAELELFLQVDPQSPYVVKVNQTLPKLRGRLNDGPTPQP